MLVFTTIVTTGCLGGGGASLNPTPNPNADSYFELHVSPQGLVPSQMGSMSSSSTSDLDIPTHVAARLVYSNGDRYERTTDDINAGIISLKVPPGEAVLQVVVVHEGANPLFLHDYALISGAVENDIVIGEGEVYTVETKTLEFEEFRFSWIPEVAQRIDPITKEFTVTSQDVVEGHYGMGEIIRLEGYLENPIYSPKISVENQKRFLASKRARNDHTNYDSSSFRADLIPDRNDHTVASAPEIYVFAQARVEKDDDGNYQFAMVNRQTMEKELVDQVYAYVGVYLEGSDWGLPYGKYHVLQALYSNSPSFILTWDE